MVPPEEMKKNAELRIEKKKRLHARARRVDCVGRPWCEGGSVRLRRHQGSGVYTRHVYAPFSTHVFYRSQPAQKISISLSELQPYYVER